MALFYLIAFFHEYFPDFAFDFGNDVRFGKCFDWRGTRVDCENVSAYRFAGFNGDGRDFVVFFFVGLIALLTGTEQKYAGERCSANAM